MDQLQEEGSGPVHGFRLSTVAPSRPTGNGTTHEPTGLDLAMKLHYLKVVYIYSAETARDLTVPNVKGPLFTVNDQFPWITGRFRRHDTGRPYIKCNDCGTRFVECQCDLTVEEWLRVPDRSIDESLVYHRPVGPELAFSPLIYIQMTQFRCGGIGLGLSWAHIMGDPLSLSHVFNLWTRARGGEKIHCPKISTHERGLSMGGESDSIKRVDPVGDLWVTPNNKKMTTFSFSSTLDHIQSHLTVHGDEFETVSGIIWKCISNARGDSNPAPITIIRSDPKGSNPRSVRNSQVVSSVHVDFSLADASLEKIVKCIKEEASDERSAINAIGASDDGVSDFIVYGAKLTFVDLSNVDFYEARIRETSPESVYCAVQGIGDDGAVILLPAAKKDERVVTMTLPEEEMAKVKRELNKCGLIKGE